MNKKIIDEANRIVKKIEKLSQNTEFAIGDYMSHELSNEEKFEVLEEFFKLCKDKKISIINTQEGMVLGMPWVFIYKKT